MKSILSRAVGLLMATTVLGVGAQLRTGGYDPLAVEAGAGSQVDLTIHDTARNRDIPVRIYLPANKRPEPVILFSHGLGGSRTGSRFLGGHWAARGYVAVFMQHPGSDEAIWKTMRPWRYRRQLRKATSVENFMARVQDVSAVLDQFQVWNADQTNLLAGRLDMKKVGMSGHSFGAMTTEAVSGKSMPGGQNFEDPHIQAALVLSPSAPRTGSAREAFRTVKIPWMLMTGTKDASPFGDVDASSRLKVYPELHGAPKYEVVLHNAKHSAFLDQPFPKDKQPQNPNHHRVILALSTAFWDAYLRGDADALHWLNGDGPRSVMEAEDEWRFEGK